MTQHTTEAVMAVVKSLRDSDSDHAWAYFDTADMLEELVAERDQIKAALASLLAAYDTDGPDENPFFNAIDAARAAFK